MRIALVTADWPCTTGGGIATLMASLAAGLHEGGHEVEVWTRGGGPRERALRAERRPWPVHGLPGRSWRARGDGHWRRGVAPHLDRFRPDAAVLASWDVAMGALPVLAARGVPVRLFAHGRDVCGDPGADRRAARDAVLGAGHRWFCLTRWMRGELAQRGVDPGAAVQVPAAVPAVALDRRPEAGRVLAVGRLVPRKGFDVLLEAIGRLPSGARLDVVGEGSDRARLAPLAAARPGRVTLHGSLPGPALEELWARASCFALPVRDEPCGDVEGFGLVYLEAAARGVAAVGGRCSGAAEAVVHGETGLLVDDPRDPAAVAEALAALLDDPVRATELGAAGRALHASGGLPRHLAAAVVADLGARP